MKPPVCTKPREVPEQGDAGQDLTLQAPFEARRCDFGASRRQGCPSPPSLALPSCADSPWAVPWRAELQKKKQCLCLCWLPRQHVTCWVETPLATRL